MKTAASGLRGLAPIGALLALLAMATPAGAQSGYITSRANCVNNESFTWRVGGPRLRRTSSRHYDYLHGGSHTVYSDGWPALRDTWRSAAIHAFEGWPTKIGVEYVLTYVPCYDNGLGERRYCWEMRPVWVYMYDRWRVRGTHYERVGSLTTTRFTDTTDCCPGCI